MKNHGQDGMTLIEVIVSVGILSMGILMFLVIINGATGIMKRGTDLNTAGALSSEALEIFNDTSAIKTKDGAVSVKDSGSGTDTINGKYESVTVNDVTFTVFVPDPIQKDG